MNRLSDYLNQDCFCFSPDVDALKKALQADSVLSDWWPHLQDSHSHLFSATGLFVSQTQLMAMHEAVRVLHEAMTSTAWRDHVQAPQPNGLPQVPRGVFMGYDFHLTESGPKLIEINTNAGGGHAQPGAHAGAARLLRCSPRLDVYRDRCEPTGVEVAGHVRTGVGIATPS
jgi:hypothetical protein